MKKALYLTVMLAVLLFSTQVFADDAGAGRVGGGWVSKEACEKDHAGQAFCTPVDCSTSHAESCKGASAQTIWVFIAPPCCGAAQNSK